MTTSNDPRGRGVEIYSASQTALAEAAESGFVRRAYYDWSPSPQDEPQDDEVLGAGFHNSIDAAPAAPDLHRGGLTVDWPMDLIQCGHALAEVFGLPATTGTSAPYAHTFSSATAQVPSRTFERKLASGQFDGAIGAIGRSIRFPIGPERGSSCGPSARTAARSARRRQTSAPQRARRPWPCRSRSCGASARRTCIG